MYTRSVVENMDCSVYIKEKEYGIVLNPCSNVIIMTEGPAPEEKG